MFLQNINVDFSSFYMEKNKINADIVSETQKIRVSYSSNFAIGTFKSLPLFPYIHCSEKIATNFSWTHLQMPISCNIFFESRL